MSQSTTTPTTTTPTPTVLEICKRLEAVGDSFPELSREQLVQALACVRWYSVHEGAKRVCDKARAIFAEQQARASASRYHHLTQSVIDVPGISLSPVPAEGRMIYDPAYGESEIGSWTV